MFYDYSKNHRTHWYAVQREDAEKRERVGTAADLRDNDSPAVYLCWAFNLGSWSSHDDDAAASSPFRRPSPSISNRRALSAKKKEKNYTFRHEDRSFHNLS